MFNFTCVFKVSQITLVAARLGQFCETLKTRVKLNTNFFADVQAKQIRQAHKLTFPLFLPHAPQEIGTKMTQCVRVQFLFQFVRHVLARYVTRPAFVLVQCWYVPATEIDWVFTNTYTGQNTQKRTTCNKPAADLYSKLVGTSLLQDLVAMLVPSLLTSCYKPAADLLQAWWTQQPCYKLFQQHVIGLQVNNLSTSCESQTWYNLTK